MLNQGIEFIRIFENRIIELVFRVTSSSQASNPKVEHSLVRGLVYFTCEESIYKLTPICKESLAFEVEQWCCAALIVAFEEEGSECPGLIIGRCLSFQKNDEQMRNLGLSINKTMKIRWGGGGGNDRT